MEQQEFYKMPVNLSSLCKDNKRNIFDDLYNDHCDMLYGVSLQIGSSADAEEIVALTFIRIFDTFKLFNLQKCSLRVWIIQALIVSMKEFLDSKNINYIIDKNGFPNIKNHEIY